MIKLRNIPFSGWFILMIILCYGIANPSGISLYGMWVAGVSLPISVQVLITLIIAIILLMTVKQTFRSLGLIGLVVYVLIIAALLWVLSDFGFLEAAADTAIYWVQIPLAFLLTLGMQWPKIRLAVFGERTVDDPETPDHAHE